MSWANHDLIVYHGTDYGSAQAIVQPPLTGHTVHSIDLTRCARRTDFGPGFYTTTNIHQARNWANLRAKAVRVKNKGTVAALVELRLGREKIAEDQSAVLAFVTEGPSTTSDYWEFIRHCRGGAAGHLLKHNKADGRYDFVFGPVSLWTQTLVIKDCDQVSLHTDRALDSITQAAVIGYGTAVDPFFTV